MLTVSACIGLVSFQCMQYIFDVAADLFIFSLSRLLQKPSKRIRSGIPYVRGRVRGRVAAGSRDGIRVRVRVRV